MNRVRLSLSCALATALISCTPSSPQAPARGPAHTAAKAAGSSAASPLASAAKVEPTPPPEPVALAPDEPMVPPEDVRYVPKGSSRSSSSGSASAPSGTWGDSVGDAFGAGGLGLTGIGEGGSGRGEGIGIGRVGTLGRGAGTGTGSGFGSGHGRLGGSHRSAPPRVMSGSISVTGGGVGGGVVGGVAGGVVSGVGGASGAGAALSPIAPPRSLPQQADVSVKTGEWDDNANFREYTRWIASEHWKEVANFDARSRRFLVVRDASGRAVPSCSVDVTNGSGKSVEMLTTSSGRAILFPFAEGFTAGALTATARCQGAVVSQSLSVAAGDAMVELKLPADRVLPAAATIDIAFILDTTGSMSEEIEAMKGTLQKVADQMKALNIRVRVGLVEYKDRGDEYVTRTHAMTTDIAGMQARIGEIRASGGGDTPEHVNQAVRAAVQRLKWKSESVARLAFLIGDAPPHLDYQDDEGYAGAVREANHEGIQMYTIAASGMDPVGQVVWRQIAQYTGATNMFVLRGGAGPQSTGGGDPRDSCGGTHTDYRSAALDQLIVSKIQTAIRARDADPTRIAGLGKDENDKPCEQRVVMMQ